MRHPQSGTPAKYWWILQSLEVCVCCEFFVKTKTFFVKVKNFTWKWRNFREISEETQCGNLWNFLPYRIFRETDLAARFDNSFEKHEINFLSEKLISQNFSILHSFLTSGIAVWILGQKYDHDFYEKLTFFPSNQRFHGKCLSMIAFYSTFPHCVSQSFCKISVKSTNLWIYSNLKFFREINMIC